LNFNLHVVFQARFEKRCFFSAERKRLGKITYLDLSQK